MSSSDINFWYLVISLFFNFISVPSAIFFARENRKNSQFLSKQNKIEELAQTINKLERIASIEHAKIPHGNTQRYGQLIREGVLTNELVDNVVSKCKKYGLSASELTDFKKSANCALANKHWDTLLAYQLVAAAQKLSEKLQPHTTMYTSE